MAEFLRALKSVIENFYHEPQDHIDGNKMSSKVLTLLKYWSMHTSVSPSLAYKLWLEAHIDTLFTKNLLRK